jgi:hypothetical protein
LYLPIGVAPVRQLGCAPGEVVLPEKPTTAKRWLRTNRPSTRLIGSLEQLLEAVQGRLPTFLRDGLRFLGGKIRLSDRQVRGTFALRQFPGNLLVVLGAIGQA